MNDRKDTKSILLGVFAVIIGITVFIKNAWVSEDAYILFRSLEQLFAGNGPIWNPHERVQVFTSPLWYMVLIVPRFFSYDVFLNAIFVSLLLWITTILILKQIFNDNNILLLSILSFSSSTAFFDYTSSGLENILAYCLIALYFYYYFKIFHDKRNPHLHVDNHKAIKYCLVLFGLIMCVRHDLLLLILVPTIFVINSNSNVISRKKWITWIIASLSPFIIYTLASLIYYGFPFPNTAYAKLNTGIVKFEIIKQGIKYFYQSLKFDLITTLVIFGSLAYIFFILKEKKYQAIGYSLVLNLGYIVYVGGDFMQGRFLSYSYLISILVILYSQRKNISKKANNIFYSTLLIYLILYPHTPFTSPLSYANYEFDMGVADERGVYFEEFSLLNYLSQSKGEKGYDEVNSQEKIIIQANVGFFGYTSGTERIIIDPLAITDPLLSKLPAAGHWRIGHFRRNIPDGYIKSITNGSESLTDPELNRLYIRIKRLTQSPEIFSKERLIDIFLINIGF